MKISKKVLNTEFAGSSQSVNYGLVPGTRINEMRYMCYDEQFHSCIVRAAKCETLYKIWAMLRESNLCGYYTMGVESIIPFDVLRCNHEILLKGIKELPVEKTAKLIEEHYMIVPEVLHEKQCKKSE